MRPPFSESSPAGSMLPWRQGRRPSRGSERERDQFPAARTGRKGKKAVSVSRNVVVILPEGWMTTAFHPASASPKSHRRLSAELAQPQPGRIIRCMTVGQPDLIVRPLAGRDELELFCQIPYFTNTEIERDLDSGHRRLEWLWVALRDGQLAARAGWWGRAAGPPEFLDVFDIADDLPGGADSRAGLGAELLLTAMRQVIAPGGRIPEYSRFVPADWRDHAESRRVVQDRMAAAELAGARLLVERLRLEWRARTPLPPGSRRITFRPADDQAELTTLLVGVLDGTLDAHDRATLTRESPEQATARRLADELTRYQSPRDWWRIAARADGQPVGFVIPAHNGSHPIIAYLGVLPAHRGKGYAAEILAEGTRILAGQGAGRIEADTDLGNLPMAAAFERTGWCVFGHEINMTWA